MPASARACAWAQARPLSMPALESAVVPQRGKTRSRTRGGVQERSACTESNGVRVPMAILGRAPLSSSPACSRCSALSSSPKLFSLPRLRRSIWGDELVRQRRSRGCGCLGGGACSGRPCVRARAVGAAAVRVCRSCRRQLEVRDQGSFWTSPISQVGAERVLATDWGLRRPLAHPQVGPLRSPGAAGAADDPGRRGLGRGRRLAAHARPLRKEGFGAHHGDYGATGCRWS